MPKQPAQVLCRWKVVQPGAEDIEISRGHREKHSAAAGLACLQFCLVVATLDIRIHATSESGGASTDFMGSRYIDSDEAAIEGATQDASMRCRESTTQDGNRATRRDAKTSKRSRKEGGTEVATLGGLEDPSVFHSGPGKVRGEEHEDKQSESLAVHYFFVISMAPWSSAARPGCIPLERREAVRASMYRAAGTSIETLDSAAAQ